MNGRKTTRNLVAALFSVGLLVAAREASAACTTTPSTTHICISHNGDAFLVDTGAGPVEKGPLTMNIGTAYTFEWDSASIALESHPFYLTDNAVGAGDGTKITTPSTTGPATFTPTASTPSTIYYQCDYHPSMGAAITIVGGNPDAGTDAGTAADAGHGGGHGSGDGGGNGGGNGGGASSGTPADAGLGGGSTDSGCSAAPETSAPALTGLAALALSTLVLARRKRK